MPRRLPDSLQGVLIILLTIGLCVSCKPKAPAPPTPSAPPEPDPPISYSLEVRPILAQNCFPCHGTLDSANQSGIRLDSALHATAIRAESGAAPIVPGDPRSSALLQKLFIVNPDDDPLRTDRAHTVTAKNHATLTRWIKQGGSYEAHWAFQSLPTTPPEPATVQDQEEEPTRPLTPRDWLRRATLDLTGLLPSPAELQALESALKGGTDPPVLYRQSTDRLLESPAFGEHLASLWLQFARYADHLDPTDQTLHSQWPYRDWVVNAFNSNLPIDQFLTHQLAGDLSPNPTQDQLLATAFQRLHPLPPAPGKTDSAAQSASLRTESFARTFLGLDLRCAKCHQHPHDPLSPSDYTALSAFFDQIGESGIHPGTPPAPSILLPTIEQAAQLHAATQAEGVAVAALAKSSKASEEAFLAWLGNPDKLPLISDLIGAFTFDGANDSSPNQALTGTGHALHPGLPTTTGIRGKALKLDGSTPILFPELYRFHQSDAWTVSFWIFLPPEQEQASAILLSRSNQQHQGLELRLDEDRLDARFNRDWPGSALGIRSAAPILTAGHWHQIAWSHDGSGTAAGLRLHLDGRSVKTTITADHLWKDLGTGPDTPLRLGAHPNATGPKDALLDDFQVFSRALTNIELAHLYDGRSLTDAIAAGNAKLLRNYYESSIHEESRRLMQSLPALRKAITLAEAPVLEVSIMRELPLEDPLNLPKPLYDHLQSRTTPGFLPPLLLPTQSPIHLHPNRASLAFWLTRSDHPLTARVFVNRVWANFFAHGLVDSLENLGLASSAPSDPTHLDRLTQDFIAHHWDLKHLCRQIVLSTAYHQAPTRPLDPIRFRDQALAAVDLLDRASGGPPQPSFRRSLYTPWFRTTSATTKEPSLCPATPSSPPPVPGPKPLQEAERLAVAQALSSQLFELDAKSDTARLTHVFRTLTSRPPTIDELAKLGELCRTQKTKHSTTQSPEQALWTAICESLLKHPGIASK